MNRVASQDVCAITVTYGDRQHLLNEVVGALVREHIPRVVVVDNGCEWDVFSWSRRIRYIDIDVVRLAENLGSAGGYKAGIERVVELGARFLWLLDDDNCPQPGALAALLGHYERLLNTYDASSLAVSSFRVASQQHLLSRWRENPYGKFFRVNVRDLPRRLVQRFLPVAIARTDDATVSLVHAPYGGLLLHRDVIARIGYPNQDFVVYSDDLEYTERLTASGGAIELVIESQLLDLEPQGHDKMATGKDFFPILSKGDDATVFYAARNQAYLDYRRGAKSALYGLNRATYLGLLWVVARLRGRMDRFRLIAHAIKEGEAGRLGRVDVSSLV